MNQNDVKRFEQIRKIFPIEIVECKNVEESQYIVNCIGLIATTCRVE